jgi:hypothetical protein
MIEANDRIPNIDVTDVKDVRLRQRGVAGTRICALTNNVPGFENAYLVKTGVILGCEGVVLSVIMSYKGGRTGRSALWMQ